MSAVRGAADDLEVARSLADGLPGVFLEGDFAAALVRVFDQVLAPVQASIDSLDAYLDPRLAPPDFLPWLAGWLGLAVEERWTAARTRSFLLHAAEAFRWRGTRRGIALAVRAYTGVEPEVRDTGGVSASLRPGAAFPGEPAAYLLVRVPAAGPDVDAAAVDRIVADAKPAHVPHHVEVTR